MSRVSFLIFILSLSSVLGADAGWERPDRFFAVPRSGVEVSHYLYDSVKQLRETDSLDPLSLSKIYAWAFENAKNDAHKMIDVILAARLEDAFVEEDRRDFQRYINELIYEVYLVDILNFLKRGDQVEQFVLALVGHTPSSFEDEIKPLEANRSQPNRILWTELEAAREALAAPESIFFSTSRRLRILRLMYAIQALSRRSYLGVSPSQLEIVIPNILGSEYRQVEMQDLEFLKALAERYGGNGLNWFHYVDARVDTQMRMEVAFKSDLPVREAARTYVEQHPLASLVLFGVLHYSPGLLVGIPSGAVLWSLQNPGEHSYLIGGLLVGGLSLLLPTCTELMEVLGRKHQQKPRL